MKILQAQGNFTLKVGFIRFPFQNIQGHFGYFTFSLTKLISKSVTTVLGFWPLWIPTVFAFTSING